MRFWARIFAVVSLLVGVTAAVPAVTAHASADFTVGWTLYQGSGTVQYTYSCSGGAVADGGDAVVYVSNGCSDRVWLHEYTDGSGNSYCVNPGAVSYASPGDGGVPIGGPLGFEQAEPTGNSSACDAGSSVAVNWVDTDTNNESWYQDSSYSCVDGQTHTAYDPNNGGDWYYDVDSITNNCNVRVWLHANLNGSGNAVCIDPGAFLGIWPGEVGPLYFQVQITANQAPCSAGGYSNDGV
jgi:hypothetical protein